MTSATFEQMSAYSPFELAAWWADRSQWSSGERTDTVTGLCELAVMSALGQSLRNWIPLHIHRALSAGATLDEVATAIGLNTAGVRVEWTLWAVGQRQLYETTPPGRTPIGLSAADMDRVRALF